MKMESHTKGSVGRASALAVASLAAVVAGAATHIYTPVSGVEAWSGSGNWSAVPASGAGTALIIVSNNATVLPNALANTNNNDVAAPFNLNSLTLQGTGPASGLGSVVTLGGGTLRFVNNGAVSPSLSLDALNGTAGLTYVVTAPLTLATNLLVRGDGTATFRLGGALGGAGALVKEGGSAVNLDADSSATYSGGLTARGGTLRLNTHLGGKLPAATALSFDGSGGTFVLANGTGGAAVTQSMGPLAFLTGVGSVDVNRPGGGNTWISFASGGLSRSVGALGVFTVSAGSNGSTAKTILVDQPAGYIGTGLFYGSDFAFYDAAGYVRSINYASDSVAYATSGVQSTLAVTGKHVQFSGSALATSTANGAGSGTSLTLADATNFAVGQPLTGTGIAKRPATR